jgi:lysophospholipase L1-like esterase
MFRDSAEKSLERLIMPLHRSLASAVLSVGLILFLCSCGGGGGGGSSAPPPAPSATTNAANPVLSTTATLNGSVNPNGLATTAWFEYGTDALLAGVVTKTGDQSIGSGNTPVSIAQPISGLIPGNTYYYQVAARNSAGTSRGAIGSFTAVLLPPTVSTSAADPISNDNAVLNGDVNPNGLPTNAWFEWGTDPILNTFTTTLPQPLGSGSTIIALDNTLSGLTPGTTYYFRVVAQNSAGPPSRGTIENFKASQIPSTTTNAATLVLSTTATLNGSVNPNGLQTNYWFLWGTDPNLTNPALTNETLPVVMPAGTFTTQAVSAVLPSLNAGTTYYFRVVASNVDGEQQGKILNFTTSVSPPPTVITNAASLNPATTSAVLNGNVNPNGYATNAWFEWGTSPTLATFSTTSNQPLGSGTTSLAVNATISGLTPYRTYYYRVAASNSGGTQKGAILPTSQFYVAVGDSITAGSGDPTGDGYEPKLSNLLTASRGYLNTIAKEGVSGATSDNGANSIAATLSTYPFVNNYLILYGTNDADSSNGPGFPVPKATYKSNMQAIITAIKNAGKTPYLAKVPYTSDPLRSDTAIQDYNAAIDELRASNGISVVAPDLYSWFESHPSELADGIHPNGTGYQSMANLWFNALP